MDAPAPASRRRWWLAPLVGAAVLAGVVAVFPKPVGDAIASSGLPLPPPVVATLQVAGIPVQGPSDEFAVLYRDNGRPVTWERCTVEWQYDPTGAPPAAFAVIQEAFDRASTLTGIDFVYKGETAALPQADWVPERRGNGFQPVQVVWASPASSTALTGAENAVALPAVVKDPDGQRLVGGAVVFNRDTAGRLPMGFDRGSDLGAVTLHEIGHLLGLAHVDDQSSLMHPGGRGWRFGLTAGDQAGFAAMGAACSRLS